MTSDLTTRVAHACRDLIPSGARVLVAVSGGLDSLALLHLVADLAPSRGWTLAVAHYNHRQDPEIDDHAVATLGALAATLGLPFLTEVADLPPGRAENPLRQARYAFLDRAARTWGASHVAVGHHADDQAETLLLRLLRGAVAGLGGMRADRPLTATNPDIRLVRPLLTVHRADLQAYGEARGLRPIEDPSNANLRFRRNVVRQTLLPAIENQWPGSGPVLARTAHWLQDDDDYLQRQAAAVLATLPPPPADLPVALLNAQPGPIRRRLLRAALAARGVPPLDSTALAAVELVLGGERTGTPLPGDWQLRRHGGWLSVTPAASMPYPGGTLPLVLQPGEQTLPGWPYRLTIRPATADDREDAWQIRLPMAPAGAGLLAPAGAGLLAPAGAGLHWRPVRDGDRLPTDAGRLKAGELLRLHGLSPEARRSQLVLADAAGLVWIVGIRRGNRLAVSDAGEGAWLVHAAAAVRPER